MTEYWSWILTIVGVAGFILAGKKVWWCWYINIACQALWMTYAIVTEQWGFIVASLIYTVVFTKNAIGWTREHRWAKFAGNIDFNEITVGEIDASKITTGVIDAKIIRGHDPKWGWWYRKE